MNASNTSLDERVGQLAERSVHFAAYPVFARVTADFGAEQTKGRGNGSADAKEGESEKQGESKLERQSNERP